MKEINADATLTRFLKPTIAEIQNGIPEGYELSQVIDFELSVISKSKTGGGIDLKIVRGDSNIEKE